MPLMGDFVDHRWDDAKETLRNLDPDYVSKIESRGQSEQDWLTPAAGLPDSWHDLLAACDELHLLASMVQAAAIGLTPFPYLHGDLDLAEVGQLSAHNGRSWFVHAKALAERTKDVIRKTTKVYIKDRITASAIAERHCKAVEQLVERHIVQFQAEGTIAELRHEYAHGNKPSWASSISNSSDDYEYLWEAFLASDATPRRRLEEGFFPTIGCETIEGNYSSAVEDTKDIFDRLALILLDLEKDIADHN